MKRHACLLVLCTAPLMALASNGRAPLISIPSGDLSSVLACDFTPDGFRVAGFESPGGSGAGPQPGDPCLPLLAKAASMKQPFAVGRYPAQVALLRPDPLGLEERSLVWTLSRGGHLLETLGCSMDPVRGELTVNFLAASAAGEPTADVIGATCLDYLAMRTARDGARLAGPIAVALNPGTAAASAHTGLLYLLVPHNGAGGEAKVIQCDRDAQGELRVKYLERSQDPTPDATAIGEHCLEVLAAEQGVPEEGSEARLALVGPLPVPEIEECLIFDFVAAGPSATCCPCAPVCACGLC